MNSLEIGPLQVSEFVDMFNQTVDYAYPEVLIEGEVASFGINQSKYVFFDLKDGSASLNCFMMVWQLRIGLEDGMKVRVRAKPKLRQNGRFSLTVLAVQPIGEGDLKRSFEQLKEKLSQAGYFDESKKQSIPAYPNTIGLISSDTAAGSTDFLTILKQRWGLATVKFAHVQVQGDKAPDQIVSAITYFDQHPPDVLVLVRGGGSLEDLWAFNTEEVVIALATTKIPTIVGVGHEEDVSLADLAADVRAATPTHAAQLVVPDRAEILNNLHTIRQFLSSNMKQRVSGRQAELKMRLNGLLQRLITEATERVKFLHGELKAYNPQAALDRGYSMIYHHEDLVKSIKQLEPGDIIRAQVSDGSFKAKVSDVN